MLLPARFDQNRPFSIIKRFGIQHIDFEGETMYYVEGYVSSLEAVPFQKVKVSAF